MTGAFRVALIDQGWLAPSGAESDLCSHGHLRLVVGDIEIVGGREEYGIAHGLAVRSRSRVRSPSAGRRERV